MQAYISPKKEIHIIVLKNLLFQNNLYICSVTMNLLRNISDISALKSLISGISSVSIFTTTTTTP